MADSKKYRRSNGEGSVFRHANGRWCGQIDVGVDENGKRRRKSVFADTRAEVVKKLAVIRGEIHAGRLIAAKDVTLRLFLDKWLRDFKRPAVSLTTYEWYVNISKKIPNDIKDTVLSKVNSYQVQSMLNTLKNDGASVRTVKAVYDLLNQLYKAALGFKMAADNPMDNVRIVRKTSPNPKALTADQRVQVIEAVESNSTYKPIVFTMIGLGLRVGEVLALTWADIDFDGNMISINKAAKTTPVIGDSGAIEGHYMAVGSTKTDRSNRALPMPQFVRNVLWEWRKEYMKRFRSSDVGGLVFPNKSGQLRSYSGFRRQFARFLEGKGIEKITFHQFRHTFATMMLEQQVNPRIVQEFLGHKDISTTLGIYTSVTNSVMKQAADGVDMAMRGAL